MPPAMAGDVSVQPIPHLSSAWPCKPMQGPSGGGLNHRGGDGDGILQGSLATAI